MSHEATLIYSVPLIREAVYGFWRRSVGLGMLVAIVLLTGMLTLFLIDGDRSWRVGAMAVTVFFGVASVIAIYVVHYANAVRKLKDMGSPQATIIASESSFTVTSGAGSATLPWSSVIEVWQFKNVWLLLFSKAQFFTLPLSYVPAEFRTFILQRVAAAGGKIHD